MTSEKLPFLAAHLGTLYTGAISLPLNPRFTADELRYFLQDSGARVVVAGKVEQPVIESLRPSCRSCAACCPTPKRGTLRKLRSPNRRSTAMPPA